LVHFQNALSILIYPINYYLYVDIFILSLHVQNYWSQKNHLYFIWNEISLYDTDLGYEKEIISRIYKTYGVSILQEYLHWTVRELLEYISNKEKEH